MFVLRWGVVQRVLAVGCVVHAYVASHGQVVTLNERSVESGLLAVHAPDAAAVPGSQEKMTGGLVVGDFDNDGDQDVFWLGGGGTPDKLFINHHGVFVDEASSWGVDVMHAGCGAAAGDYDDDGWLDIYVTSFGPSGGPAMPGSNRLYRNVGGFGFIEVAHDAGVAFTAPVAPNGYGAAFGDYDLDGDLDLFVAAWQGGSLGNRLFRNDGDGTFTDVTYTAVGASMSNVHGFQPAFADMNGDLYPELLVAADFETSRYYANDGDGTFTDLTDVNGTGVDDNGMGQAVGDVNNDGLLDWYVTSVYGETPPDGDGFEDPGNMLYMNLCCHQFAEVSEGVGCIDGGWGWGTVMVDLDQDGWLDIVEVNGWNPVPEYTGEQGRVFYNLGGGVFFEMAALVGFDHFGNGRSLAAFDADGDGDQDLIIGNNAEALSFYRNDTASIGGWLRVALDTSPHPLLAPDGFGATVAITTAGQTQVRVINGSPSYLATSEFVAHFGVGDATVIDELRVHWPRGQISVFQDVAVGQLLTIVAPIPADIDADGSVGPDDLMMLLEAWGSVRGTDGLRADVDGDGVVGVLDVLVVLGSWG